MHPKTYWCAEMTMRVSIRELTSVASLSIIRQMGEGVGPLGRSIHRRSPTSSEEKYDNLIDCAFSDFFVGRWGLWLLPLAPVASDPYELPNREHVTTFSVGHSHCRIGRVTDQARWR